MRLTDFGARSLSQACLAGVETGRSIAVGFTAARAVSARGATAGFLVSGLTAMLLVPGLVLAQPSGPPPWERTETRDDCTQFDALRSPFFGDTHVHTEYSADGWAAGAQGTPRDAYAFAKGAPLALAVRNPGDPPRVAQLDRPLDFTVVTDHSEQLGEVALCKIMGSIGYDEEECANMRDLFTEVLVTLPPLLPDVRVLNFLAAYLQTPVTPFTWCGSGRTDCLIAASPVWEDIRDAAEEHYDRTSACGFTSFIGYEWTAADAAIRTIHRNVIFRNELVPAAPISFVEESKIGALWDELETQCLEGIPGCDVLTIPHNSNLSGGKTFVPVNDVEAPLNAEEAARRARMEPLVEIINHKGESECQPGVRTNDELCAFEKAYRTGTFTLPTSDPEAFEPLSFVRNALKEGLAQEEALGVNPFRVGFVGGTDTHNATPGIVKEEGWGDIGHFGRRDASDETALTLFSPGGMPTNPSGLAVFWAEENSRDSLFSAMRRRETYSTSGPRMQVRFFGGDFKSDPCEDGVVVEQGYSRGVPMGAEVGALRKGESPKFLVQATKDPGGGTEPSIQLQRIQIIKGWVDDAGETQEEVFEVAGDPDNGAGVDLDTCTPNGTGFDSLCTMWEDPNFDAGQRAFYYARVLENPTCRWHQYKCNEVGVDCDGVVPFEFAACCDDDLWQDAHQERAWTSPIFYTPESFGKTKSGIKLKGDGEDTYSLKASFLAAHSEFDPNTNDIVLEVADDDTIYSATIPAGTMVEDKPGEKWSLKDKTGAVGGIAKASLKIKKGGAQFALKTVKMDLSNADPTEHFVHTTLRAGTFGAVHQRLWEVKGSGLKAQN